MIRWHSQDYDEATSIPALLTVIDQDKAYLVASIAGGEEVGADELNDMLQGIMGAVSRLTGTPNLADAPEYEDFGPVSAEELAALRARQADTRPIPAGEYTLSAERTLMT